ncbi:flagellar motor protein MotD [Xanthomonas graminis]|uniref:Flagellar motor protein MotD n=1 Tax=Xanthomonas graminis pv. poae TaxID=227946 RepID=A0A199P241_9XANT|nr:flagellar motor protein MotD [Xanthomonas translucens]OAX55100.1 flagellar motor protein MotD [Xanthomonas translucens pv. poae]
MARKRQHEDHVNHEAWAIPYADLMTLLLAFFVVMYALSTVNEAKYRVMADAMSTAFGGAPRTMSPVQVGEHLMQGQGGARPTPIKSSPALSLPDPNRLPSTSPLRAPAALRDEDQLRRAQRQLDGIADRLGAALAPLIQKNLISVRHAGLWIEVEINSDILFGSGSASLDQSARATLAQLAQVLVPVPNGVRVEGYTDNSPIATVQFPSNWELSAARAASVVHLFADQGLQPSRLSMIGYGEFRPRADNDSQAGRNANRRVVLVILADAGGPDSGSDPAPQDRSTHTAGAAPATPLHAAAAAAGHAGQPRAVPAAIEGVN